MSGLRAPLPPGFRSVYRLFLRACSTSVLHQPRATQRLRRLWRPVFDGAALMIRKHGMERDTQKREEVERWISGWNTRIDGTLEFLCTSSKTRGLPHQVTRNLWKLVTAEERKQWLTEYSHPVWNPKLDAAAAAKAAKTIEKNREKRLEAQAFANRGFTALSEVVALAEARDELSLGRVIVKRKVRKFQA